MTNDTGTRPEHVVPDREEIEQALRSAGRLAGCRAPDSEPGVDVASWINVSRFVEATGDENPLYTDVQYGAGSPWHTMLAPPTFVLAVRAPESVAGLDPPRHGLTDVVRSLWFDWDDLL